MKNELDKKAATLLEQGRTAELIEFVENLSEDEMDTELGLNLGEAYMVQKDYEDAYRVFKKYPIRFDTYWRYCVGFTAFKTRRWQDAYANLKESRVDGLSPDRLEVMDHFLNVAGGIAALDAAKIPFAVRVEDFWDLFLDFEMDLRDMIGVNQPDKKALEYMNNMLKSVFREPNFRLAYKDNRYQLTLSVVGQGTELYKLIYWNNQAPEILREHWDFYTGIQPKENMDDILVTIGDITVTPDDIEVWASNRGDGRLNLDFYCHKCAHIKPEYFYYSLCQILYQCIGEIGVVTHVCSIDILQEPLENTPSMSLRHLREYIEEGQRDGLLPEVNDPINLISNYEMKNTYNSQKLREDIESGTVPLSMVQILEHFTMQENPNFFQDAVDGVTWGYVFYRNENISEESRIKVCEELRDELDAALGEVIGSGGCLGNANGHHYSYLECVAMDLERFLKVVNKVMRPYLEMYQIEESGFSEFRQNGQIFAIDCEEVDLELDRRIEDLIDEYESGGEAGRRQRYIVEEKLHGKFPVEDVITQEGIELPEWDLTVNVDIKAVKEDFVSICLKHYRKDWDRPLNVELIGVGSGYESAVDDAFFRYEHMIETDPLYRMFEMTPIQVSSSFMGVDHKWDVYVSETEIQGDMGRIKALDFWKYYQEDLFRYIGDQKVVRVEFTVGRLNDEPIALCQISHSLSNILQEDMDMLASLWTGDVEGVQKQRIILVQKEETRKVRLPYSETGLDLVIQDAYAAFTLNPHEEVLSTLYQWIDNPALVRELFVYLPEICAQFNYIWGNYPEKVTLKIDGELVTVNTAQIYTYNLIERSVADVVRGDRAEALDAFLKGCVNCSKTKAKLEEMGILDKIHELWKFSGDMMNMMETLGNLERDEETVIELVLDTPEGFELR